MTNLPLIKIEVEHMRQSMIHAFTEHTMKMDQVFQHAITEACQPEKIQQIVDEAARRYLKEALDDEIKSFFYNNGAGRKIVAARVAEILKLESGL